MATTPQIKFQTLPATLNIHAHKADKLCSLFSSTDTDGVTLVVGKQNKLIMLGKIPIGLLWLRWLLSTSVLYDIIISIN